MTIQVIKGDLIINAVWDSVSRCWMYRSEVEWLGIGECGIVASLFDIEDI